MKKTFKVLAIAMSITFFLSNCQAYKEPRGNTMQTLEDLKANMAFTCKHEIKSPLPSETQKLYNYALYQDLHNMWNGKKGDVVWQNTLPYYRIAAMNGDYKANVRLQYLISTNRVSVKFPSKEVHRLNKVLEKQLPATSHYNTYKYLVAGFGVETEKDGEYVFLRRAADLGSSDAQYEIANILMRIRGEEYDFSQQLSEQFLRCASEQGHAKAGLFLGIKSERDNKLSDMVIAFHSSTKNGSSSSARRLSKIFKGIYKKESISSVKIDLERAKRYEMIEEFLYSKEYLNPTVPDLDDIVPLPPAKLPAWDGKIAFQRWFEGPAPEKPSDELMKQLADQAGLDWQTGLPLKK